MICRQARWPLRKGRFGIKRYLLHIVTHCCTLHIILITHPCYKFLHAFTHCHAFLFGETWCLPAVAWLHWYFTESNQWPFDSRKRIIHVVDPTGDVYPIRIFLLAINADGAEVGQLRLSGLQCPCCMVEQRQMDRTDNSLQLQSGAEVSFVM